MSDYFQHNPANKQTDANEIIISFEQLNTCHLPFLQNYFGYFKFSQ